MREYEQNIFGGGHQMNIPPSHLMPHIHLVSLANTLNTIRPPDGSSISFGYARRIGFLYPSIASDARIRSKHTCLLSEFDASTNTVLPWSAAWINSSSLVIRRNMLRFPRFQECCRIL